MKENWGDTASDYSWPIVPVPGQLANDCNQPEAAIGRDSFAAIAVDRDRFSTGFVNLQCGLEAQGRCSTQAKYV